MQNTIGKEPLLVSLVNRVRLPWYFITLLITIILLLFLVLVGYLDGGFLQLKVWEFWRVTLQAPIIIAYILLIYPVIIRLGKRALEAFRPLIPIEEQQFNDLITEVSKVKRWQEWLAILIGSIFILALSRPWIWVDQWIDVYQVITSMLMFGILGWLIYSAIYSSRSLSKLSHQNLKLDIFNINLLSPIAHLSLGNSLAFIGGISLSLVFQTQQSLLEWPTITIYSVLVLATIQIFFISMWNIHGMLIRVKRDELNFVRDQLESASKKLKNKVSEGQQYRLEHLSLAVAGWAAYERKVQTTQEWPFNATIVRRLFASVLAPASIYLIKILSVLGIKISF